MKKRILVLSLTLVLALSSVVYAAGAINGKYDGYAIIKVYSGGKELKPDNVPAMNYKGSTLVPIGLLRQLGVEVVWNGELQRVDISLPTRTVPILTAPQLEQLSEYVYLVHAEHPDPTKVSQGSGFILNGTLITNYHVGGDSAWTKAMIDGKWQQSSAYAFANEDIDLMGFKVSGGRSLPYSAELPQAGDIVYSISFPGGKLKIAEGKVYGISKGPQEETQIIHSAYVDNGGSGSPLLNGKGEVIGVNRYEFGDSSIAIPMSYLVNELK